MNITRLIIRPATIADLPRLHEIAGRAVWSQLAGRHYTVAEMDAARDAHGYHVEPELVEDGTYYLVEADGVIAGGSGWSARGGFHPPLVGGAEAELDRAGDVAVMRASYVDPDWIRRGLGTLLARTTETAAELSGFTRFEAMCTPASEAMRRRLGYRLMERAELPLVGGVSITMAHMGKDSTGATGVTACREPASAAHR